MAASGYLPIQNHPHAKPPRSNCAEHGVRVVHLPWAEPNSRFTALFESIAIEWLKVAS